MELYLTTSFIKSYQQLITLKSWAIRLAAQGAVRLIGDLLEEKKLQILSVKDLKNQSINKIIRYFLW